MTGEWVLNAAIILVLALGVWSGWRRGFIAAASNLLALLAGLAAASAGYKILGQVISEWLRIMPSGGRLLAYLLILMVSQFLLLLLARTATRRLIPQGLSRSRPNMIGGAALGLLQAGIILAVILALLRGAPLPAAYAASLKGSILARPLAAVGQSAIRVVSSAPGSDISETIRLLTVDPESQKTVRLGYTTTDVRVSREAEDQMLALVNRERTSRGLAPLKVNDKARAVGRQHSRDMFARGYFSHLTPEGVDPFGRLRRGGVEFLAAGENIALAPDIPTAHKALMDSAGHRANILSPNFSAVGIGVIDGGPYGVMVSQEFIN